MTLTPTARQPTGGRYHRGVSYCFALAIVSLVAWASCGPVLAQAGAEPNADTVPPLERAPSSDPNWFESMLARTAEPLPITEVASADGFFRARVPAKLLQPIETLDGFYLLTLDFGPGADALAECYVYDEALDLAGSLLSLSDAVFGLVAESYGAIEAKAIQNVDAGGIGATPYMGLAWIYRAQGTEAIGGRVAGQAKHWMAIKQGRAVYCQSTAVGYDEVFFELFRSFVSTLDYAQPLINDLHYAELALVEIGGKAVGVVHIAHRIDQDGDVEVRETSTILLPIDSQTMKASDTVRLDYSDRAGDMVARVEVKAEGGEVVTHLNLAPNEAGEWVTSGVFQGKDLEANLGHAALRGHFGERLDLRHFIKTAEVDTAITFRNWTADLDPTRLVDTTWTYRGRDQNGLRWQVEAGSMAFDAVSDDVMELRSMVMPIGGTEMTIERIYTEGDVFAPLEWEPAPAAEHLDPGE